MGGIIELAAGLNGKRAEPRLGDMGMVDYSRHRSTAGWCWAVRWSSSPPQRSAWSGWYHDNSAPEEDWRVVAGRLAADDRRRVEQVVGDRVPRDRGNVRSGRVVVPEPTLMVAPALPVEVVGPTEPRIGTPVMLPGWILEMPPQPITKKGVLIGVPLTLLGVDELELLPSEGGETRAPGNGTSSIYPPVVRTITPRLGITGARRSSRTQSFKSGRNIRRDFMGGNSRDGFRFVLRPPRGRYATHCAD